MCILDLLTNSDSSKSLTHKFQHLLVQRYKHSKAGVIYYNDNISMMNRSKVKNSPMFSKNLATNFHFDSRKEWDLKTSSYEFSSDDRERSSIEDNDGYMSTCTLCTSSFSFCQASQCSERRVKKMHTSFTRSITPEINLATLRNNHHDHSQPSFNGSRMNSSIEQDNLALHYASARGCLECVQLIMESSQEISANTQMDNDVTPCYLAAQEGHLDVLKFLVESGGSLYVRAKDGMTALHAASQMNRLEVLKWMVEDQGVDPNLRDGDGATPLHFAASRGHMSIVKWLLNHGAKLSLDKYGKSPINDAAENQQTECLNILVQHSNEFMTNTSKPRHSTPKAVEKNVLRRNSFVSKCSAASSDSEPFYLHPPNQKQLKDAPYRKSSPDGGYYGALPNDGIFINPMRATFTPPSPSDSTESFFLHDPQEVIYNRVKEIFESDTSVKEEPMVRNNAMTVQAEIHSSSSGAASCSDDDLRENMKSKKIYNAETKASHASSNNHDYEDIYLVREEAKISSKNLYGCRSRSRDSGSHSRSASTSSTRSHDVVVQSKSIQFDTTAKGYEIPRKSNEKNSSGQSSQQLVDSTYESVGPSESVYMRKNSLESEKKFKHSSPIDVPMPPPLPPPLKGHNFMRNANRDSSDSLTDSIDFNQAENDTSNPESDSGLEVIEEPTLRPSELVRGNNNRTNKKSKFTNSTECGLNTTKNNKHRQQNEQLRSNTTKTSSSGKVHQQQIGASSSVGFEQHSNQEHESIYNGVSNDPNKPTFLSHLVNKQLVLPIIAFPNSAANDSNHLIKPSEYLKSIGSDKHSSRSSDTEDYYQISNEQVVLATIETTTTEIDRNYSEKIPVAPPPLPANFFNTANNTVTRNSSQQTQSESTIRKHQPLSSISIQDLNSVQLRRTDNKMLSKTFSAPTRSISMQCLSSTNEQYLSQKTDLIAELKMSKDITGIKKMKVERAKMDRNSEIPDRDSFGNIIPDWKRQMLAKKAADKAKKEFEDRLAREAEDRRLSAIPKWKRDLIARKEEAEHKMKSTNCNQRSDNNLMTDTWRIKQRAMSIDNISFLSPPISQPLNNNEYERDFEVSPTQENCMENLEIQNEQENHQTTTTHHDDAGNEDNNIIPWKKLLRKTNSRLSLIS
ncbi:CLUMA_CG013296, isoform A [Clunio marinus]|uniref:CLUMA_CG013296, isoform A n=1 Tax=Clunio marinus TaxID=568069 RepID=A0A1J1ILQ5_9DIPT|nr:CLUMA_CG013296, isoform A [Clunio marinus]